MASEHPVTKRRDAGFGWSVRRQGWWTGVIPLSAKPDGRIGRVKLIEAEAVDMERQPGLDIDAETQIETVVVHVADWAGDIVPRETIEREVREQYEVRAEVRVRDFLPVLVERSVRRRLRSSLRRAQRQATSESAAT